MVPSRPVYTDGFHPRCSLSLITPFYGRFTTRVMKTVFKSKKDNYLMTTEEKQQAGHGRKVLLLVSRTVCYMGLKESFPCVTLQGAADGVTGSRWPSPACCGQKHWYPNCCWLADSEWITASYSKPCTA